MTHAPEPTPDKPKAASRSPSRETESDGPPRWILPAVMIVILTVGGWFVIQTLTDSSRLEDCEMQGRHNCVAPVDTSKMGH
jgi:hypothetical protein